MKNKRRKKKNMGKYMGKCTFFNCRNESQGSKQFNDIVERIYLCADCLIRVAHLDSWHHGMEFIKMLEESKDENYRNTKKGESNK